MSMTAICSVGRYIIMNFRCFGQACVQYYIRPQLVYLNTYAHVHCQETCGLYNSQQRYKLLNNVHYYNHATFVRQITLNL